MTIIRLFARICLQHSPTLVFVWWALSLAGFSGAEHIIATIVWAVTGSVGVRAAMRISFATAHILGAMEM